MLSGTVHVVHARWGSKFIVGKAAPARIAQIPREVMEFVLAEVVKLDTKLFAIVWGLRCQDRFQVPGGCTNEMLGGGVVWMVMKRCCFSLERKISLEASKARYCKKARHSADWSPRTWPNSS